MIACKHFACRLFPAAATAIFLTGVATLTMAAMPRSAAAQPYGSHRSTGAHMDPTLGFKFMLGFGGEVEVEATDDDLEPTLGVGADVGFPLHDYFVLGGLFAVNFWLSETAADADLDRNTLIDLAVVPKGRLPLSEEVALYLALPVGLCLDFVDDSYLPGADPDTGLGFGLSFLFGVTGYLSRSAGLYGELGYSIHSFEHDVDLPIVGTAEIDVDMGQFLVHAGVLFDL